MPVCRRGDRDLPSWPCEFDSLHPLHVKALVRAIFAMSAGHLPKRIFGSGHYGGPLVWPTRRPSEPQLFGLRRDALGDDRPVTLGYAFEVTTAPEPRHRGDDELLVI
jgi:hypothetical protein